MDKKLIAAIGGVILIIGAFLPIASGGGQNPSFMFPGEGTSWEGLVLVACGLLGVILALIGQAKHAVWFGLIALGLLVWKFLDAKKAMDSLNSQIQGVELPPEIAAQVPSLNMLGWGVLCLGALVLIVGGALAWKGPAASAPAV